MNTNWTYLSAYKFGAFWYAIFSRPFKLNEDGSHEFKFKSEKYETYEEIEKIENEQTTYCFAETSDN